MGTRVLFFGLCVLAALNLSWLEGGPLIVEKAPAVLLLAALYGFRWLAALPLASVFLFWLTFPPFNMPFYVICFAPLIWLWRYESGWFGIFRDSFAPGFTMIWVSGADLRAVYCEVHPVALHALGAATFGLQTILFALVVRAIRNWPTICFAPAAAAAGAGMEIVRVTLSGWPTHLLHAPAAPTPLAQWAFFVTSFGVSALLYLVNILCLPGRSQTWTKWLGPGIAVGLLAVAWIGGLILAGAVEVRRVPLSVVLVQPHHPSLLAIDNIPPDGSAATVLDRLTLAAVKEHAPVDLVVWPECAVESSILDLSRDEAAYGFTLQAFYHRYFPKYGASCLVGLFSKYPGNKPRDTACLITPDGRLQKHDRLLLAAFNEAPPPLLTHWPASYLWEASGLAEARLDPGADYQLLEVTNRAGAKVVLGVSICYEVNFPWLPQYQKAHRADLIIHLTDESDYRQYPYHFQHATWQAQYRAIETRTWQLLSGRWSNSAVINPKGEIVSFLGPERGYVHHAAAE